MLLVNMCVLSTVWREAERERPGGFQLTERLLWVQDWSCSMLEVQWRTEANTLLSWKLKPVGEAGCYSSNHMNP